MNKTILTLALVGATMGLSGCVTDGYGSGYYGTGMGWGSPYAYDGWYDGYYGSIYDGYWGADNYFYYRNSANDRAFRRADRQHFRRDMPQGQHNYRQHRGEFRPQQGYTMPQFQGGNRGDGNRRRQARPERREQRMQQNRQDRPRAQPNRQRGPQERDRRRGRD